MREYTLSGIGFISRQVAKTQSLEKDILSLNNPCFTLASLRLCASHTLTAFLFIVLIIASVKIQILRGNTIFVRCPRIEIDELAAF